MSIKVRLASFLWMRSPRLWMTYRRLFRKHQFEAEYWLLPLLCKRQKRSLDIGANMGEFAYAMRRYSRDLVAFEPNRSLWPFLKRFLGDEVRIEGAALSDRDGEAVLRYCDENSGVATIESVNALSMITERDRLKEMTVPIRSLDSFAFEQVGFIKIDVEGHEEAVLRGAAETVRRERPNLLVETEDRHNAGAPARVFALMRSLGYNGYFVAEGQLKPLSALVPEDQDPRNLRIGRPYINNFIFLPEEESGLPAQIDAYISARG